MSKADTVLPRSPATPAAIATNPRARTPRLLLFVAVCVVLGCMQALVLQPEVQARTKDPPAVQPSDQAPLSNAGAQGSGSVRLVVQVGHTAALDSVCFSPDGRLLATGSDDKTARIWDVATGSLLRTLSGHTSAVECVCFSPDGQTLATASGDNTARLWDVATGNLLHTLSGHKQRLTSVCFSPDGRTLATASWDDTARLWDVATGNPLLTFTGHVGAVDSVIFSMDGRILATTSSDRTARLWDVATGRLLHTLIGHSDRVNSADFSPDATSLATASNDGTARIWAAATGSLLHTLSGHTGPVESVRFSPDGRTLSTGSKDNTARLWDVATGRLLHVLDGHAGEVASVTFSPDGRILASGSLDHTARLWDVASGRLLHVLSGHTGWVTSTSFSPDGRKLATGSDDHSARLWSIATGRLLHALSGHTSSVESACFSPDGRTLAIGSLDKSARIWDMATGRLLHTLSGHTGRITCVGYSPDGRTLATGSWDRTACLWDVATGNLLHTLSGHTAWVQAVAFSPDGRTVATGGWDGTARLWDVSTGSPLATLSGPGDGILCMSFSPDGRTLAARTWNGTSIFWDAASGKMLRSLNSQTGLSGAASFSPDGRTLAGGSWDGTSGLWDAETGKMLHALGGPGGASVSFSRNGRLLATGSADGTAMVWDERSGRLLRSLEGHASIVSSTSFSPDGQRLATGSGDCSTSIWDIKGSASKSSGERQLCQLYAFDNGGWAVVTPDGRFDGDPTGLKELHWVCGLEPIELDQLRDEYYEPHLLAKLMPYGAEPLRAIDPLSDRPLDTALYPRVSVSPYNDAAKTVSVHLDNQGGGFGRVEVYVNGSRFIDDARPPGLDPSAKTADLILDVSGAPTLLPAGNRVGVIAYNAANWLPSRAAYAEDARSISSADDSANQSSFDPLMPRSLYAIVCGISQYKGPEMHLNYPAQDAQNFAAALHLAAVRFAAFGPNRVHITLLTSPGPSGSVPTKERLRQAFADIKAKAHPEDVLVIYLAGHGVALGRDNSLYAYPTYDAAGLDREKLEDDDNLLARSTVTSEELDKWLNGKDGIAANYRVMVLDTCAAGAAANAFGGKAAGTRDLSGEADVPGDQYRALQRFQDRSGLHLLMGCAADKVSYEADCYGEGILTYALLQGMKGAALQDGKFVDVGTLFNHAVETVPTLIQGSNGGLQKPLYNPPSSGSFDIGEVTADDEKLIPLNTPKPMLLRPVLIDTDARRDDLHLTELLRQKMEDACDISSRGDAAAQGVFVDADAMAGALGASGTYTADGKDVRVDLVLVKDDKTVATIPPVNGSIASNADKQELVSKLSAAVMLAAVAAK